MNPQAVFCPNLDCPARGQVGKGNINSHSQQEQRYSCEECGEIFAATKGTIWFMMENKEGQEVNREGR